MLSINIFLHDVKKWDELSWVEWTTSYDDSMTFHNSYTIFANIELKSPPKIYPVAVVNIELPRVCVYTDDSKCFFFLELAKFLFDFFFFIFQSCNLLRCEMCSKISFSFYTITRQSCVIIWREKMLCNVVVEWCRDFNRPKGEI